ncbi:acyl-CoA synthetase (AMP-forming)/AMP-acid ligase II [Caldicoprobacter guelmensis]|uniref:class I adenylate-forming enzyme family protein n=1 Tax=Caldicoprobacter guelmensis TaxID=1170224 RepID=UPI0019598B03|nr:class I adenylate-forming enzyme family protein [Caldicoprobacter guelmensis]MBM7581473.1 acyl-CoA synthetase (AMP-forming)/AMP-acid ligase II [Caldicoprobacter guelmensis]
MPITNMLSMNAQIYPDEVSLIERDPAAGTRRQITWKEFDDNANKFANFLLWRGIKKGDKVAILLMNCLEWLPVYFGILKAGAWAVPLNFRFTAEEILKCLETAEVKVLVYGPEFEERVDVIRGKTSLQDLVFVGYKQLTAADYYYYDILNSFPSHAPDVHLSDDEEAALYFTSGTTGIPKPIVLTHGNLVSACITENHHHMQTHEDNFLCIPPLYHTGAKMHWFGNLIVGAKAVILRGVSPKWILEAVSEEQVTIVWLLVPWAQDILDAIERGEINLSDYKLDQWWLMHMGAQPVPPSLIKRWKKYFPHHKYDTNYGLSEATGPGCVHLGLDNIDKVGAIGLPGHGWQVMIVDENGNSVPPGQIGELIVKGPGVMKGYYKNPEATSKVLKDGWLYTGDMARQDEDGFIYLVDRKKDIVICGGENIFPVEIEDYLRSHQDIKDAAVIGLPDRRLGEIPVAIVELKPGRELTEEDVIEFCQALPRYKRPRRVFFDKIPRNPTGKIEKPKLREKWCGQSASVFV